MNDLCKALSNKLGKKIVKTEHQEKSLQGGTLGDVRLVSGVAETESGEKLPFEVVYKKQKKWERDGHPFSWRCEYDLYQAGFDKLLCGDLHIPACCFSDISEDEISFFIEYVNGVSGADFAFVRLILYRSIYSISFNLKCSIELDFCKQRSSDLKCPKKFLITA
jgi:hypothetical protein